MKKRFTHIVWLALFLLASGLWALNADYLASSRFLPEFEVLDEPVRQEPDTVPPRYPVSKTTPEEY